MKQLLITIAAMPKINYILITLADSPIIPLWITDIIGFFIMSVIFLFGTLLLWGCWAAIKAALFIGKKFSNKNHFKNSRTDVKSFKITTIDFWIAWQGPVLLWCSIIFLQVLPLPDPISNFFEKEKDNNLITSAIAPALIWSVIGFFYGFWKGHLNVHPDSTIERQ